VEGSGLGLIDVISQNLLGGTRSMSRPKFEPSAFQIQVKRVTATVTGSTENGRKGDGKRK
jgi:hypothetical protein